MKKFTIKNTNGVILRTGECLEELYDLQAQEGESIQEGHEEPILQEPIKSWQYARREEYPTINEQLEALWDAMDVGVLPKIEPIYTKIKNTKTKYPKRNPQ